MKRNTRRTHAIIIGDSTNNTLSIVRSLGEAKIDQTLIFKCESDVCHVGKSRYLKRGHVFRIEALPECLSVLEELKDRIPGRPILMCSFDEAAVFIDNHEPQLSPYFRTPARGKQIGKWFDKDEQCRLAHECGLLPPAFADFNRHDSLSDICIPYPVLLKPLNSTRGEKSDIHICQNRGDVEKALAEESLCDDFVVQEFIDKEYELDCVGVRTEHETYIPGAIRKIRHYPPLVGAGAFGLFTPIDKLDIDVEAIKRFLLRTGYFGPFSVEFLHKGDKNYFMEVNFRNEGLAYAATAAGANLHALYVDPDFSIDRQKVRPTYMMNYSLDYLYVKSGDVSRQQWWRDFLRTRCFINFNLRDPMPTLWHYLEKIKSRLAR